MQCSEDSYVDTLNTSSIYRNDIVKAKSYNIEEFDPLTMCDVIGNMSITAMTGAGKTVLIIDILSKIHHVFDAIYMFSRTAKAQPIYDFIPRRSIFDRFNEEFLVKLWNIQYHKKMADNTCKMDRILIIMDDIINDEEYKKSKILNDYFTGARHYGLQIMFLTQNFTSLKLLQRNNVRWAVAFDLDAKREREKFVQSYLSAYNDRVGNLLFNRIVKEKPYQCVVVEIYKNGAETEEKVKKYIANPKPRKFKLKENPIMRENPAFCTALLDMSLRTSASEEEKAKGSNRVRRGGVRTVRTISMD